MRTQLHTTADCGVRNASALAACRWGLHNYKYLCGCVSGHDHIHTVNNFSCDSVTQFSVVIYVSLFKRGGALRSHTGMSHSLRPPALFPIVLFSLIFACRFWSCTRRGSDPLPRLTRRNCSGCGSTVSGARVNAIHLVQDSDIPPL